MTDLNRAVKETVNVIFSGIEQSSSKKKRLDIIKANIGKVVSMPLDDIETSENIREIIDTESESFLRLVESVKKYGVLENVVVELRLGDKNNYRLVCIAGHRRILAAKASKSIVKIPCLLQAYENKGDNVGAALAENINREDLHCLDVAQGYLELMASGWNEKDLSDHFCRDVRTIRHYLKMAKWSSEIKKILRQNPQKFSTRVIMRQFAYKKFTSDVELKAAIKLYLQPNKKVSPKKKSVKNAVTIDKKQVASDLDVYLSEQNTLSHIIKEEIKKAFSSLKLI